MRGVPGLARRGGTSARDRRTRTRPRVLRTPAREPGATDLTSERPARPAATTKPPSPAGPHRPSCAGGSAPTSPLYLLSIVADLPGDRARDGPAGRRPDASPFVYSNDATAVLAHFQTVLNTGWYEFKPQLGAPVGQTYHDFPQADNLHMMFAW